MAHFLHTADLHLGRNFKSIGGDTAVELEAARYQIPETLERLAKETGAQFVVIAGDLLDTARPSGQVLAKALQALGHIKIPIYCIPGNHDPGGPLGPYDTSTFKDYRHRFAPNLHLLQTPEPVVLDEFETVLFPCPIIGYPTLDPTTWLRNREAFAKTHPTYARVVIAHGGTLDFSDDEKFVSTISLQRLPREEIDYMALGDWHGTLHISDPIYRYAGSPEADKFPLSVTYRNGLALEVKVQRSAPANVTEHSVGRYAWTEERRTVRDAHDIQRLDEELLAASSKRGRLLKLVLEGSLNVADAATLAQAVKRLKDVYAHTQIDQRNVLIAPGATELEALTNDRLNQTVANVATKLALLSEDPQQGPAARLALVKLYESIQMATA